MSKMIFNGVSVISAVKTGSDQRIVRDTLTIRVKLEMSRLIKWFTIENVQYL